ncbi:TetR/AcrR family transcriptional regulator [Streptomyces montanisoli]|uniref:TetR/AcrR family transcriptional regulator n=1 Tax=Streptomyces montanisoli TaxID=2798581 RepID=A0A940RZ16_9ACTN|nr:TetR/AcrR family transcriptional regulator [Streptomyces montanisoli]MBP0459788.1 TetR/AcrR family transcriptional regulator [Streptomyces montanisoli]
MTGPSARPPRADARANEDKLLAAAATAFARDGADATLKQIAKDAGVGIGTLYRRFPTRERLVDATYRYETARLAARTAPLLTELPVDRALRTWMSEVLDYLATKHGMADILGALLRDDANLGSQTREQLTGAVEEFRMAGTAQGVIRAAVPAHDIVTALAGITLAAGAGHQREQAERLLDLLMDGLTRPTEWRADGDPAFRDGEHSAN